MEARSRMPAATNRVVARRTGWQPHGLGTVVVEHLADPQQQRGDEHAGVEGRVGGGDQLELVRAREIAALRQYGERHEHCDHGPRRVGGHHQQATVMAIGEHARGQREQQPRQPLRDDDGGDEQRVAGNRRRQPRIGDESDAVAEVGDRRRAEQAPIVAPEPVGGDARMGVGDHLGGSMDTSS
jgi:hypothetical protein